MLKLAICDDDSRIISRMEKIVEYFNEAHEKEEQFEPAAFTCSMVLRDEIVDGKVFDAFVLDIEMERLDGFALAYEIRRHLPLAAIVFLSSHTEYNYTQEGYKVRALRYVSKLTMETSMMEALDTAAKACKITEIKYYTLSHYNDIIRVPLDEIVYIHRVSRTTEIVTADQGRFVLRKPLKTVMAELGDKRFIYSDRSCIVNGDHVVGVENNTLTLRGGETLPVSRKIMPTVKLELLRLWGGLA